MTKNILFLIGIIIVVVSAKIIAVVIKLIPEPTKQWYYKFSYLRREWFFANKKTLYWLLFLATLSITVIPIISKIIIEICPSNMEWLSSRDDYGLDLHLFGIGLFFIGWFVDIFALTSFLVVIFLIFFKQSNLKISHKFFILLYFTLLYFILLYIIFFVFFIEYMAFADSSTCYLQTRGWK